MRGMRRDARQRGKCASGCGCIETTPRRSAPTPKAFQRPAEAQSLLPGGEVTVWAFFRAIEEYGADQAQRVRYDPSTRLFVVQAYSTHNERWEDLTQLPEHLVNRLLADSECPPYPR